MLLTSLALLAAPLQVGNPYCVLDPKVEIQGVITGITGALPAPYQAAAPGDSAHLILAYAGDVLCVTTSGMDGYVATSTCSSMKLGGAEGGLDPSADYCNWGETYASSTVFDIVGVECNAVFAGGLVTARLLMTDPLSEVGIGLWNIIEDTIDVPSVTAAGFSVSLELIDPMGAVVATIDVLELSGEPGGFGGFPYCDSNPNSTGQPAIMAFVGSDLVAANDVSLLAFNLPTHSFAYFLTSRTQAFIPNPGGSAGILCVGSNIGRFVGPGQVQATGTQSNVMLAIDLTQMPQATGAVVVQPGETWNFTCWFRDVTGSTTSNFANGSSVTFH